LSLADQFQRRLNEVRTKVQQRPKLMGDQSPFQGALLQEGGIVSKLRKGELLKGGGLLKGDLLKGNLLGGQLLNGSIMESFRSRAVSLPRLGQLTAGRRLLRPEVTDNPRVKDMAIESYPAKPYDGRDMSVFVD